MRQKLWQVGKCEIETQSALGRLEIGGVLRCAGAKPLEVVIGCGHLHHAGLGPDRRDKNPQDSEAFAER
jgi:hypothetical protein